MNRSQTYLNMGKYKEAEWDALRAVFLNPCRPKSAYRLLKAASKRGGIQHVLTCAYLYVDNFQQIEELIVDHSLISKSELMIRRNEIAALIRLAEVLKEEHLSIESFVETKPKNKKYCSSPLLLPMDKDVLDLLTSDAESSVSEFASEALFPSESIVSKPSPIANECSGPWKLKIKNEKVRHNSTPAVNPGSSPISAAPPFPESVYQLARTGSLSYLNGDNESALQKFKMALNLMQNNTENSELEEYLQNLKFSLAFVHMTRSTAVDVEAALKLYKDIPSAHPNLPCPLAYYGLGLAHYTLHGFKEAIPPLELVLQMSDKGVRFPPVCWPGTNQILKESKQDVMKSEVEKLLALCRAPPIHDAICRLGECFNKDIYFSNLKFKGYVELICNEHCVLQYHPDCWKILKNVARKLGDKEWINLKCSTPDCGGVIAHIKYYGPDVSLRKEIHGNNFITKTKQSKATTKPKKKIVEAKTKKKIKKHSLPLIDNKEPVEVSTKSIEAIPLQPVHYDKGAVYSVAILKKASSVSDVNMSKSTKKKKTSKKGKKLIPIEPLGDERIARLQFLKDGVEATKNDAVGTPICNEQTTQNVDSENPFYIPPEVDNLEALEEWLQSQSRMKSVEAAICQNVFSYIEDLLKIRGSFIIDSQEFLNEVASFPTEVQQLISQCGDFVTFLLSSDKFTVRDNMLILSDNVKKSSTICSAAMDDTQSTLSVERRSSLPSLFDLHHGLEKRGLLGQGIVTKRAWNSTLELRGATTKPNCKAEPLCMENSSVNLCSNRYWDSEDDFGSVDTSPLEETSDLEDNSESANPKELDAVNQLTAQLMEAKDKYIQTQHIMAVEKKIHEDLCAELRNTIDLKEKELATVKGKINAFNKQIGEYKKLDVQKKKLDEKVSKLKKVNEELQNKVSTLLEHLNDEKEESERIHKLYAELQVVKLQLQEGFDEEKLKLSRANMELDVLKQQHSDLLEKNNNLMGRLKELERYKTQDSTRFRDGVVRPPLLETPVRFSVPNLHPRHPHGYSGMVPVQHPFIYQQAPFLPRSNLDASNLQFYPRTLLPCPSVVPSIAIKPASSRQQDSVHSKRPTLAKLDDFEDISKMNANVDNLCLGTSSELSGAESNISTRTLSVDSILENRVGDRAYTPKPLIEVLERRYQNLSRVQLEHIISQLKLSKTLTDADSQFSVAIKIVDSAIMKRTAEQTRTTAAPPSNAWHTQETRGFCLPKGTMGLDKFEEFNAAWMSDEMQRRIAQELRDEDLCSICCEKYIYFPVVDLDCFHKFHLKCIEKWFLLQNTCPICRRSSSLPSFPPLT